MSLEPYQSSRVTYPTLLDTVAAMTLNGHLFYTVASVVSTRASERARDAAQVLFVVSPFALLHPLGFLVRTGEYSLRWDWIYAGLALAIALLSQRRQRRAFYYAAIINLGAALFEVASHRQWFDRTAWAIAIIVCELAGLAAGFAFDWRARRAR